MEDIDQIFIKRKFLPNHLLKSPIVRDPSENFKLWVRTFKTTPVLVLLFKLQLQAEHVPGILNAKHFGQGIELIELYLLLCWVKDSINMQQ
ncbi:unnamed protein product [Rhizophagus irregularis]|nr:unnamed protein product [Rhizophagus irregularis]